MDNKGNNANVIDAIAEGAGTGMQMVIAIAASLVGIIGIVAVINMILGFAGISLDFLLCIRTVWFPDGT